MLSLWGAFIATLAKERYLGEPNLKNLINTKADLITCLKKKNKREIPDSECAFKVVSYTPSSRGKSRHSDIFIWFPDKFRVCEIKILLPSEL